MSLGVYLSHWKMRRIDIGLVFFACFMHEDKSHKLMINGDSFVNVIVRSCIDRINLKPECHS